MKNGVSGNYEMVMTFDVNVSRCVIAEALIEIRMSI
jgi:hypothetical protein